MKDSLQVLISRLAQVLNPLMERLSLSDEDISVFVEELGYNPTDVPLTNFNTLKTLSGVFITAITEFESKYFQQTDDSQNDNEFLLDLATVVTEVGIIIAALEDMKSGLPTQAKDLPSKIYQYFVIRYLECDQTLVADILKILGLIETPEDPVGEYRICWDRIPLLLKNPTQLFKNVYSWGTPQLDTERLFRNLLALSFDLGHPALYEYPSDDYLQAIGVSNPANLPEGPGPQLVFSVLETENIQINLGLHPMSKTANDPMGLGFGVSVLGRLDEVVSLGGNWSVAIKGQALSSGVAAVLMPDQPLNILNNLQHPSLSDILKDLRLELTLQYGKENESSELFSMSGGTVFKVGKIYIKVIADIQDDGKTNFGIESSIEKGTLLICFDQMDSFLSSVMPKELKADFDFTVGWATDRGLYFKGSGVLEFSIPLDITLGPIHLDSILLMLGVDTQGLKLVVALTGGGAMGPVAFSIERIGLTGLFAFEEGNLGPLNFELGFKPPNGAGLVIDCSAVTGGGYLSFDDDAKTYDGILQLRLGDFAITAIGMITTKMPDGSKGFSMLLILCVEFSPPIQLSFGFTLSGIGGLAGYNRTMVIDALQTGLRSRTLDSILFPQDPIKNAPKIISDLRAVFPPAEGRFVLGPMIKLGWGSPNIITADIGVFIELPQPIRIVLLGQIAAILPNKDNAIIELHIDILGVLDFEQKSVAIDATIYDSRILTFNLSGDMALRFSWGDNPCFAMSLGGFHPQFSPPPGFPTLRRLTLSLSQGENFQIFCRCYQALTSNSLQFGSSVELSIKQSGASIEGGLTFDTLIYFSPFSFMVDLNGNVTIKYKGRKLAGIYIAMSLSGPKPWNAMGSARIEILFWDISVDFQVTWGDAEQEVLPSIDPWEPLREALERNESWGSLQPQTISLVEIIRPAKNDNEPAVILIHPAGMVEVRQNVLPFGVQLQKLGNSPVKDHYRFEIGAFTAGQGNTQVDMAYSTVNEFFARGQYQNLSETQRVSLPAFEKMPGGACAGTDVIQFADRIKTMELTYESILIQDNGDPTQSQVGKTDWTQAKYQTRGNASGRKNQCTPGIHKFEIKGNTPKVAMNPNEEYIIVKQCDLTPVDLGPGNPQNDGTMNRTQADQAMMKYLKDHPDQTGEIKVIAVYEVV